MGTKRNIVDRTKPPGGGKITAAMVDLFVVVEKHKALRHACRADEITCLNLNPDETCCPQCAEYGKALGKLELLLNVAPWEDGPTEVDGPHPPEHLDEMRRIAWRRSWATRQELLAAAERRAS